MYMMEDIDEITRAPRLIPAADQVVRLPVPALLVMTLSGFALVTTETMPAGLLPQIAAGMHTSEGTAGQYISAFALGAIVFAVPAATLTRGLRRKPVYLFGLSGFLVTNTLTTLSTNLLLALGTRLVTGAFAGLLWAMMAGYARRISPADQAGRALAIASTGVPIGLATGTPLGSWLGGEAGWRWAFAAMSILFALTAALTLAVVPDAPGQHATSHLPVRRLIMMPGVRRILAVIMSWMIAHNILYTYLAPYMRSTHTGLGVGTALVVVGVSAIVGVFVTGALIDRALRRLALASTAAFVVAGTVLFAAHSSAPAVLAALALWGLAYGGSATQLQTAMSNAVGPNADVGNSLVGTSWNIAIFTGGVAGAVVINTLGGLFLAVAMVALPAVALALVLTGRGNAFPPRRPV
jgi:predicted MFS family arabinose efflux permease